MTDMTDEDGNCLFTLLPCKNHDIDCDDCSDYLQYKADQVEEKHTIKDWGTITGIIVMDPDGFDRTDPELNTRLFTRAEYIKGTARSTLMRKK